MYVARWKKRFRTPGVGDRMGSAGVMADGQTDLHVFDRGTLTSERYSDQIFPTYVMDQPIWTKFHLCGR
ncbi:hypothetical protein TNCV_1618631 [Trichonephila clavipes]|nr:hypothetical protein TNCV_1618631 [Trichonephila clavipes]